MSKEKQPSRLCPFKKIVERSYSGLTGKTIENERFAPCAGERCMAYYHGFCMKIESGIESVNR